MAGSDKTYELTFGMSDGTERSVVFTAPAGPTGPAGPQGPQGENGETGATGKTAYEYAQDGGYAGTEEEFAEKLAQEPLIGTTADITPAQVATAVAEGRDVTILYTDKTYGGIKFGAFTFSVSFGQVISSEVLFYSGAYALMELIGNTETGTWTLLTTQLAQFTDIPTTLKNPVPLTINGQSYDGSKGVSMDVATKKQGIFYIEGTGSTAGTWLGSHTDITEYYPGLTVLYKVAVAGASPTTLNINSLGAVTVVRNATTSISTTCPVDSVVLLTYTEDSGTAYWKRADYDANTKTTTGTSNKTGTKLYLAGATSQSSSGATTYSNANCYIGTDNRLYSGGAVVPNTDEINALIDTKLAAITNAEEVAF